MRDRLKAAGLRAELDERQEKIGYKIREAQLQKVPYMLVVGRPGERRGHGVGADARRAATRARSAVSDFIEGARRRNRAERSRDSRAASGARRQTEA